MSDKIPAVPCIRLKSDLANAAPPHKSRRTSRSPSYSLPSAFTVSKSTFHKHNFLPSHRLFHSVCCSHSSKSALSPLKYSEVVVVIFPVQLSFELSFSKFSSKISSAEAVAVPNTSTAAKAAANFYEFHFYVPFLLQIPAFL